MAFACLVACVSCARQVRTFSPAAVPAVMARQVRNAIDAGEGDLELRRLRQRLAVNANDLDARVLLARYYFRQGLPDLALEHYRLAAVLFPDSVVVTLEMAKLLRDMREPETALTVVRDYLGRNPRRSWVLLSLEGILEDEQGRFEAAEAAHRAAITLEPARAALYNNLGYNLLLQGQHDSAVRELRRAIELDPKSEIASNNLGAALVSQRQPISEEALAEWQRLGGPAAAHNNLAAMLMEQGRWAEARAEIETALGFRRDFPAALTNLRFLEQREGRLTAGLPALPVANPAKRRVSFWSRVFGSRLRPRPAVASKKQAGSERLPPELASGQADPTRLATARRK